MISILLAMGLAAQAAPPPVITADVVAAAIQEKLPQRFSPDLAMIGASAEGNLLIMTFEAAPAALEGMTPEGISQRFSQGFCSLPVARALVDGPMSLRVDARVAGGELMRGAVIETCPPVQAEAAPAPASR